MKALMCAMIVIITSVCSFAAEPEPWQLTVKYDAWSAKNNCAASQVYAESALSDNYAAMDRCMEMRGQVGTGVPGFAMADTERIVADGERATAIDEAQVATTVVNDADSYYTTGENKWNSGDYSGSIQYYTSSKERYNAASGVWGNCQGYLEISTRDYNDAWMMFYYIIMMGGY